MAVIKEVEYVKLYRNNRLAVLKGLIWGLITGILIFLLGDRKMPEEIFKWQTLFEILLFVVGGMILFPLFGRNNQTLK